MTQRERFEKWAEERRFDAYERTLTWLAWQASACEQVTPNLVEALEWALDLVWQEYHTSDNEDDMGPEYQKAKATLNKARESFEREAGK